MPERSAAVLKRMRALLDDPRQWTRGALARSMVGQSVVPLSDLACCWSLSGALARSLYDLLGPRAAECDWRRAYDAALLAVWSALPADHPRTARRGLDVDGFNDYPATTHASVLQLLDCALAQIAVASAPATGPRTEPDRGRPYACD